MLATPNAIWFYVPLFACMAYYRSTFVYVTLSVIIFYLASKTNLENSENERKMMA